MQPRTIQNTILVLILFFLWSSNEAESQSTNFYYYHDEKIFLEINPGFLAISTERESDTLARQKENKAFVFSSEKLEVIKLQTSDAKKDINQMLENKKSLFSQTNYVFKNQSTNIIIPTKKIKVKLSDKNKFSDFEVILKRYDLEIVSRNPYRDKVYLLRTTDYPNTINIANSLYESGLFDYACPDFITYSNRYSNDPEYINQWTLNNTGQFGGTPGVDIEIEPAWNITEGRVDIVIAIIDDGVQLDHPDLVANLLPGFDATGNGTNGGPLNSSDIHGTQCAGIAGAVKDNNIGIAGIAPKCKILPVKVGYDDGVGFLLSTSDFASGIDWAVNNGADILSISLGAAVMDPDLDDAIQNAIANGRDGLGCPTLIAVGNENYNNIISYPSKLNNVISVGATDFCDQRLTPTPCNGEMNSGGSNSGFQIDITAPGLEIRTTAVNSTYSYFSGTSAATPTAAGIAALILSANPCLTSEQVKMILSINVEKPLFTSAQIQEAISYLNTCGHPYGTWNNEMGYGRVNAYKAVQYANNRYIFTANGLGGNSDGSNGSLFQWVLSSNNCNPVAAATYFVYRYEVYRDITFPFLASPEIIGYSNGFSADNPNGGNTWCQVTDISNTSAKLSTYVYNIISSNGQSAGWVPNHPLDVRFGFTATDQISSKLYLQNELVNSGTWYHEATNTIFAGNSVTDIIPYGDYIIQGSADVTLHAGDEIILSPGTIISPMSGAFYAYIGIFFTCSQYPIGYFECIPPAPFPFILSKEEWCSDLLSR